MPKKYTDKDKGFLILTRNCLNNKSLEFVFKHVNGSHLSYSQYSIKNIMFRMREAGLVIPAFKSQHVYQAIKYVKESSVDFGEYLEALFLLDINDTTCNNFEKEEMKVDGNHAILDKRTKTNPKNLEELLSVCNVDRDEWIVDKYTVNKWDNVSKTKEDEIIVTPLYQIKAFLTKRNPDFCQWPVVKPVVVPSFKQLKKKSVKKKKKIYSALLGSCLHVGFRRDLDTGYLDPMHDRRAIDIFCQFAEDTHPDRIILAGDILDLPMHSKNFPKTPDFYFTTQPSLDEVQYHLQRMRKSCDKMDIMEGNHDYRFTASILDNHLESYNLRRANMTLGSNPINSLSHLLDLESLCIDYHGPYHEASIWLNDNFKVSHGFISKKSAYKTAEALINNKSYSQAIGHTHKVGLDTKADWRGGRYRFYLGATFGCLCRIEDGIVPSNRPEKNWVQGFARVFYEPGNGMFKFEQYEIFDGECMIVDTVYVGEDRLKEIEAFTNNNFLRKP